MASTILNEQGWNRDWIERQLAHTESNSIRAAYNYAEHLPERRKMMQTWLTTWMVWQPERKWRRYILEANRITSRVAFRLFASSNRSRHFAGENTRWREMESQ